MKIQVQFFENSALNDAALQIIECSRQSREAAQKAKDFASMAFYYRWESGRIIDENYIKIILECGTQEEFAKRIGETPSVVSNNKRAYQALKDAGATTWQQVEKLLDQKNINPIISNFEKIGTLLAAPASETTGKQQVDKDLKRLEVIREEAQEILARMEPANRPQALEEAFDTVTDVEEIKRFLDRFNPEKSKWKSEKYLEFIRNIGWDMIKDEPCERCDPHHTLPNGGSGSVGEKLADFWVIPVSRETHLEIETGLLVLSPDEILRIQHYCMSAFLQLNLK